MQFQREYCMRSEHCNTKVKGFSVGYFICFVFGGKSLDYNKNNRLITDDLT